MSHNTAFTPFDRATWARAGHYDHYMNDSRCMHSTVVELDITQLRRRLKAGGLRAYPAQIWLLTAAVNRHAEFRTGTDGQGRPGTYELRHPSFTVLNRQTETFSCVWTPWEPDFSTFYRAATEVMDTCADGSLVPPVPAGEMPPNVFDISSLPWLEFTGFHLSLFSQGTHLAPIFSLGKYRERDGRTLLPLAIQIHHAAADGLHVGRFVQTLQELTDQFEG